jgi:hypothetical protein
MAMIPERSRSPWYQARPPQRPPKGLQIHLMSFREE